MPWVKLHTKTLTSPAWIKADDRTRMVMVGSMMLAARFSNKIPLDFEILQPVLALRCSEEQFNKCIRYLADSGFLALDASKPLAEVLHKIEEDKDEEKEEDSRASLEREHEEFWKIVPNKKSKGQSLKAYVKARKDGATAEDLASGMRRYAAERSGQDPKFTKHPATWLNGKCWLDDSAPSVGASDPSDPLADWRRRVGSWVKIPNPPDKRWWFEQNWGPPPHKPDTKVPKEILREFGLFA